MCTTVCSRMSRYVAMTLRPAQGKWNKATQQRITMINSMLGFMKNIKMLGLQRSMADHVEDLRDQEMQAAAGVRWLSVAYNASGKLGVQHTIFRSRFGALIITLPSQCIGYVCPSFHHRCLRRRCTFSRASSGHGVRFHVHCYSCYDHSSCKHDHDYCSESCHLLL